MKAKPYKIGANGNCYVACAPEHATHIMIEMRGPSPTRMLPVIRRGSRDAHPGPVWTWNGDTEKPTLKPSISVTGTMQLTDEQVKTVMGGSKIEPKPFICHTWITDGQAIYLPDSTHEFAGQTHDLLEVE